MTIQLRVFVSSKMLELAEERQAILNSLPTLNFGEISIEAWVYENDAPASEMPIREVYLDALHKSQLYIGLFWNEYGEWTIDEFEKAKEWGIDRHIYVKDVDTDKRQPRLKNFLEELGNVTSGVGNVWFNSTEQLLEAIERSIKFWIQHKFEANTNRLRAILIDDPDNLTEQPEKFIGRQRLVNDVCSFLLNKKNVTIHGFAGTGKTAFASEVAHKELITNGGSVIWLEAANNDADTLFDALIGMIDSGRTATGGSGKILSSLINDKQVRLLILDNVTNPTALWELTKNLPNNLPILLTSRMRIAYGEMIELESMDPDEALELLNFHAGKDFGMHPKPVELCEKLGYLAFAVEIAGKTIKARNWHPAELLRRIKRAPHELKVPLGFAQEGRESVADLLEISLQQLDSGVKEVFMSFGALFASQTIQELLSLYAFRSHVHMGYEPQQLMELRAKMPREVNDLELWHTSQRVHLKDMLDQMDRSSANQSWDIDNELQVLIDNGLISRIDDEKTGHSYYRMHDLAYSYVNAQVTPLELHQALDAILIYLDFQKSKEDFRHSLPLIAENLLGAASWAVLNQRYMSFGDLMDMLTDFEYLNMLGITHRIIEFLTSSTEILEGQRNLNYKARNLILVGLLYVRYYGENHEALSCFQQAYEICNTIDDLEGLAIACANLGIVFLILEQPSVAINFAEQAIRLFEEVGNQPRVVVEQGNLAAGYIQLEEYEKAKQLLLEILDENHRLGDQRAEGINAMNMGRVLFELGDQEQSNAYCEQSLQIRREINDMRGQADTFSLLGTLKKRAGDYKASTTFFKEARNIFEDLQLEFELKNIDEQLAEVRSLK